MGRRGYTILLNLLVALGLLTLIALSFVVVSNRHTALTANLYPTSAATAVALIPTPLPSRAIPTPPASTPTPTATATTPSPTATATATLSPTATVPPVISFQLALTPGQPQPYLDKFRLVAYYGSPTGPGLGILGNLPREQMLEQLRQTAVTYRTLTSDGRLVLPTYHLLTTVASQTPPYYHNLIDLALIEEWVIAAQETETAVVLDIQPGQGDVLTLYQRIRHLLYYPHVHLALDPEFTMAAGQIPARDLGQLRADPINAIQADLNQIGQEIGLHRVLVLHQFADIMLPDKGNIQPYPFVELIIDGDGVGSPQAKMRNYHQYAQEAAFEYGGFKLFPIDGDYPLLTPTEVMTLLNPPPVLIIYQ